MGEKKVVGATMFYDWQGQPIEFTCKKKLKEGENINVKIELSISKNQQEKINQYLIEKKKNTVTVEREVLFRYFDTLEKSSYYSDDFEAFNLNLFFIYFFFMIIFYF
jgi:predicted DNA-binding antitoxin AbrB/MazE fold protein